MYNQVQKEKYDFSLVLLFLHAKTGHGKMGEKLVTEEIAIWLSNKRPLKKYSFVKIHNNWTWQYSWHFYYFNVSIYTVLFYKEYHTNHETMKVRNNVWDNGIQNTTGGNRAVSHPSPHSQGWQKMLSYNYRNTYIMLAMFYDVLCCCVDYLHTTKHG